MATYTKTFKKKTEIARKEWKMDYPLTEEQELIANSTDKSVMGESVAGGGKSTTMLEMCARLVVKNPLASIFLAIFSKALQMDLEQYSNENLKITTKHALGLASFYINRIKPFVDKNKIRNLLIKEIGFDPDLADGDEARKEMWGEIYNIVNLCDKVRVRFADHTDAMELHNLNEQYACGVNDIALAQEVMKLSNEKAKSGWIDYADMNYIPVLFNFTCKQFDIAVLDECQDLAPTDIMFLEKCMKPDGIARFVGDRRQSIMGFAGADTQMMDKLAVKFNCTQLPISTTFRCGHDIVAAIHARGYHDTIQAWSGVSQGQFIEGGIFDMFKYQNGTLFLARRNAALMPWAIKCHKAGRSVSVLGERIETEMKMILKGVKANTVNALTGYVADQQVQKVEKLMRSAIPKASAIEYINDLYDSLIGIIMECSRVEDVENLIYEIFKPKKDALLFSSMHRSKGREADHVVILDCNRMTLDMSKMNEEGKAQEVNLCYVAFSRAKHILELIP